jgi:hypothetical protein
MPVLDLSQDHLDIFGHGALPKPVSVIEITVGVIL